MADLKLTSTNDLDLTNGSLSFVTNLDAHAQRARMHYQTFLGESPYDRSAGVPWIQVILGSRLPPETVRMILDIYGRSLPGILSTDLGVTLDPSTRRIDVTGTIQTIDGEFDFTITPLP